ncbi:WD repeat-containing protein 44 [Nymphon striatum]|nr:WD repeat-containing protein 44 [Nymphon striatum]
MSSSDNDEFYDAEADTPIKVSVTLGTKIAKEEVEDSIQLEIRHNPSDKLGIQPGNEKLSNVKPIETEDERRARENMQRRKKLEELRKRMMSEDEDLVNLSTPSSCTSSVDGIFAPTTTQKFPQAAKEEGRVDALSIISLGKVGQILATDTIPSAPDDDPHPVLSPEPDIVASAKSSKLRLTSAAANVEDKPETVPPVAPPRRRKKKQIPPVVAVEQSTSEIGAGLGLDVPGLPSPASTIESITKDLDFSLDIKSAIKGKYVVKPQDDDQAKAGGSSSKTSPILEEKTERGSSRFEMRTPDSSLGSRYGPTSTTNSLQGSRTNSRSGSKTGSPSSTHDVSMFMRPRSDSGRQLTDLEILEQVTVLNLDTGERIPLSLAEDRLPRGINPLSLHIMRLTSEYVSNSELEKADRSDTESIASMKKENSADNGAMKRKATKIKKMIGRTVEMTVNKIKSVADEVYHTKHGDDMDSSDEDVNDGTAAGRNFIKYKASSSHKGPYDFDNIKLVQELGSQHNGAIWTMKFSYCGRLLATAGQDHILRIWVLRDSHLYFDDMRQKYNAEARKVSPSPSQESLSSYHSNHSVPEQDSNKQQDSDTGGSDSGTDESTSTFFSKPFCTYQGHTADVLDVAWSKNYFILSSSMDKTVRLWHISRKECLCCFQHIDFVTAIAFHPRDDRFFLSGSLDGKLRLWNIPDKKVTLWNEMEGPSKLITAANFCQNGKFAVVGSYDGRCVFYTTEHLKYYTQIHVRSTRGKNAKGRKITGIEPIPGEGKILVTSNDSRVRLYDLRDLSLSCKYKGYVNLSSQIKSSFSHDGKYIISGSENHNIYIWKLNHDCAKFSSARRDRNDYWEGIKAHNAVVTSAVFAPNPALILEQYRTPGMDSPQQLAAPSENQPQGYVLVSADFSGDIKVFVNLNKDKFSSSFHQSLPTVFSSQ